MPKFWCHGRRHHTGPAPQKSTPRALCGCRSWHAARADVFGAGQPTRARVRWWSVVGGARRSARFGGQIEDSAPNSPKPACYIITLCAARVSQCSPAPITFSAPPSAPAPAARKIGARALCVRGQQTRHAEAVIGCPFVGPEKPPKSHRARCRVGLRGARVDGGCQRRFIAAWSMFGGIFN